MAWLVHLLLQVLFSQWPLPRVTCTLDSFRPASREAVFKVSYQGSGTVRVLLDARTSPGWPVRHHWLTSGADGDPGYFVAPSEEASPGADSSRPLTREDFVELIRDWRPVRFRVKVPPESLHQGVTASPSQPRELTLQVFSMPYDVRDYLDSTQIRLWPNIDGNVWWSFFKWRRFQTSCTGLRLASSRLADPRFPSDCSDGICLDSFRLAFDAARESTRNPEALFRQQAFLDYYTGHRVRPRHDPRFRMAPSSPGDPATVNRRFLVGIQQAEQYSD